MGREGIEERREEGEWEGGFRQGRDGGGEIEAERGYGERR
jgi:hypothetical protein